MEQMNLSENELSDLLGTPFKEIIGSIGKKETKPIYDPEINRCAAHSG
jgi:hypothetical protein